MSPSELSLYIQIGLLLHSIAHYHVFTHGTHNDRLRPYHYPRRIWTLPTTSSDFTSQPRQVAPAQLFLGHRAPSLRLSLSLSIHPSCPLLSSSVSCKALFHRRHSPLKIDQSANLPLPLFAEMKRFLLLVLFSTVSSKNVFVSSPFDNFRIECPKRVSKPVIYHITTLIIRQQQQNSQFAW